jgi:hypothetical protein
MFIKFDDYPPPEGSGPDCFHSYVGSFPEPDLTLGDWSQGMFVDDILSGVPSFPLSYNP